MKLKPFLVIGNIVGSGLSAFWIFYYFSNGPLVKSRPRTTVVEPDFFLLLLIWGAGAYFVWRYFSKREWETVPYVDIVMTSLTLWLTIPLGFFITTSFVH
ncbi:hypothetical protein VKA52_18320 [Halobacillus sp. HZG1]|uniref:hypothetical protein n=1 Tax=Halobacillus sp. HZG1 TaxID=3111769 RepID=UPI002DB5EC82|nr:hypothetical protein [Halobacillus sp. HZG1]MEC3885681.1 hypothetical protein [Halobacillus sp. HZG1]